MLLSAVSVLVVAQSSSEIPEGLMNNPVYIGQGIMGLIFREYHPVVLANQWRFKSRQTTPEHHTIIYVLSTTYLTFAGPCILIYFYNKTNQMHNISNLFYFWSNSLHVSDGLSVRHHESKTVHTASYRTGSVAAC